MNLCLSDGGSIYPDTADAYLLNAVSSSLFFTTCIRESGLFKLIGYMYRCIKVILTRQQKGGLVIKLGEEGKSTWFIAEAAHVSLKDIGTIIRRHTGEGEELACQGKGLSINSRAFKLFKEGKNKVDVAIALDIDADQVLRRYEDYLRLLSLDHLTAMYKELGNYGLYFLNYLYNQLKWGALRLKRIFAEL